MRGRDLEIDRQVRLLSGMSSTRIVALANERPADPERRIREETLVALIRRFDRQGDADAAWKLAICLVSRVKGRIARALRLWRLDQPAGVAEETVDEIVTAVYGAVFDRSPEAQFWEVRFHLALDRRMIRVIRKRRTELDRNAEPAGYGRSAEDGAEPVSRDELLESLASRDPQRRSLLKLSDPLTGALAADALAGLSEGERAAFVLRHTTSLPIEGAAHESGGLTISSVLGVSGRTVRNYLTRAERHFEQWREGASEAEQ